MRHVTIGPEFFAKEKNDYADWYWAVIREFAQNGIDCGSSRVEFNIGTVDGQTHLVVRNNGSAMTEETITDKLLTLGASGKGFAGTVGGFGKAKVVLYMAHESYQIQSGSTLVVGRGGEYELCEVEYLPGTESTVIMGEDCTARLEEAVRLFAACCQWKGTVVLNGEELETSLRKGAKRRELGWATIYTNKSASNRLVVRVDGMPMFVRWCALDRCVVVEVERTSGEAFQANRDSLKWDYRSKLESFIDQLNVDKSSALRGQLETEYTRYEGDRQMASAKAVMADLVEAAYATTPQAPQANPDEDATFTGVEVKVSCDDSPSWTETANRVEMEAARCGLEFIVKNNTGLSVPDYYLPTDFSAYSERLVRYWVSCLVELHKLFGVGGDFAVGFILDEDREAESERSDEYGQVFYINPAVVVEQVSSRSRSLKKRWKMGNAGRYAILAVAVHEFVHGAYGLGPHDENYANRLTEVMGVVLANKKRFSHCFAG